MAFPQPGDIAVLHDFGQREIDLVESGFKTFDSAAARVAEVFFFGDGSEEIDDVCRVFAPVGNFKHTYQGAERAFGDVFAAVSENFDEGLDRTSIGDENFHYGSLERSSRPDFVLAFFLQHTRWNNFEQKRYFLYLSCCFCIFLYYVS